MRALSASELDFIYGGNEPGGTTIPNPYPDGPGPDTPMYPDFRDPGYDPNWNGPGSGWDVDYGNITISPGHGGLIPPVGGDGVIVTFPNGTQVGVSTDADGEPNGVKVKKTF